MEKKSDKKPSKIDKKEKKEKVKQVKKKDKVSSTSEDRDNGFSVVEVVVIVLVSILFGTVTGCILTSSRSLGVEVDKEAQEIVSTYEGIINNYYDEVSKKELLDAAVLGMINTLDDPYSTFMDGSDADDFNETVDGEFVGIGVTVEWDLTTFKIIEVFDDSPASKAKLKVGDIIIKVDDSSVEGIDLEELSSKLKGKKASNVSVTVRRGEDEVKVKVKREVIEVPTVTSEIYEDNIGYLNIESFGSNTAKQFSKKLEDLEDKKVKSLIIDVRGNPGGRLSQAADILELFFNKKTILYRTQNKDEIEKIYAKKNDSRKYPVVVLVNQNSASASEILAACFKDNYKKATIIGTRTYGKGTIQKAINLSSGASLKYTTQKWLPPKSESINEVGVIPDIELVQEEATEENPNPADSQLAKAIEVLKDSK